MKHAPLEEEDIEDVATEQPYAYSLVTLPDLMPKLQQLSEKPAEQPLSTTDGEIGFLLLEEEVGTGSLYAEKIDFNNLIVYELEFYSKTIAAGYAAASDTFFVAQAHEKGQMTFVGGHHDGFHTITGYKLSEEVEVSP